MLAWIRLIYMRGEVRILRYLNRFYDALLASWHRDWYIAVLALLILLTSYMVIGVAVWFITGAVASFFHEDLQAMLYQLLLACLLLITSKVSFNVARVLLPFNETKEDDVD